MSARKAARTTYPHSQTGSTSAAVQNNIALWACMRDAGVLAAGTVTISWNVMLLLLRGEGGGGGGEKEQATGIFIRASALQGDAVRAQQWFP